MEISKHKEIIIIGSGWYGCHIAKTLSDKYNITIIEKRNTIFDNSSYYNQNRLHLGYHYCRNYNTRMLCKNYYDVFKAVYNNCIDDINNNYYLISNESLIDYTSYKSIYNHEKYDFEVKTNNMFYNIDGDIILTKEKVINSDKIKEYFINNLKTINVLFNEKCLGYSKKNNKITVSTDKSTYECDLLLDCTYNQLGLSKKYYTYELTLSLVYKKIRDTDFNAITIMDGKFSSLYPRDVSNNLYTLTDVEYTPIISSSNYREIEEYVVSDIEIATIKDKMENKIKHYYKDFNKDFVYSSYFLSKKTKPISSSDSRDAIIEEIEKNVISVNCGKIYGIFKFEKFVLDYLEYN
jgi:hypothetical protein